MAVAPPMGNPIANTFPASGVGAAGHIHEDLSDTIYDVSPEETPFVTAIGRGEQAEAVIKQWTVDELAAADDNAQVEGFTFVAQPPTQTERLENACQIMARSINVTNTLRAVNTVGGEDEFDRQMIRKGLELRRDLEWRSTRDLPRVATGTRKMAGIGSFIRNGSAGGGAGAMPTGDGSDSHTPGTARQLSLELIADAMEQAFTEGGRPSLGLMGARQKRIFSVLGQGGGSEANPIAAVNRMNQTAVSASAYVGTVDTFLSDFGRIDFGVSLFMDPTHLLLIDPSYAEFCVLPGRDMSVEEYARTGDAMPGGVIFEGTLKCHTGKAHAVLFDLLTTMPVPPVVP